MHMLGVKGTVTEFHSVLDCKWLTRFHLILIKYHLTNVDFSGKSIIAQKYSRKSFALVI